MVGKEEPAVVALVACVLSLGLSTGCATHKANPERPERVSSNGETREYEVGVIRDLVYASRGNQVPLRGDLYLPKAKGTFPGVVVVHGGSWSGRSRSDMEDTSEELARRGFVAFNIDYRHAPEFRFPDQVHDVWAAVRWMRAHAQRFQINPERIGAFGYSAGAHLVALAGVTSPEELRGEPKKTAGGGELQAVVAGGTPADLTLDPDSDAVERFLGASWEENPDLFRKASPLFHVSPDDPPFFLYHGKADQVVDIEHSKRMAEALKKAGVPVETYFLPVAGHVLAFVFDSGAVGEAIDFLNLRLR